jgi:hypothetical protein
MAQNTTIAGFKDSFAFLEDIRTAHKKLLMKKTEAIITANWRGQAVFRLLYKSDQPPHYCAISVKFYNE